jgi:hypothetical protein
VYVNFPNLYVRKERLDPTNAQHRPVGLTLKARMTERGSLEPFLSFLVRGAMDWYACGSLGETLNAMQANLNQ